MSNTYDPCEPFSIEERFDMSSRPTYTVADRDGTVVAVFSSRHAATCYITSQMGLAKAQENSELGRDFGRGL